MQRHVLLVTGEMGQGAWQLPQKPSLEPEAVLLGCEWALHSFKEIGNWYKDNTHVSMSCGPWEESTMGAMLVNCSIHPTWKPQAGLEPALPCFPEKEGQSVSVSY